MNWFMIFFDTELIRPAGMMFPGKGLPVVGSMMVAGKFEKFPPCMAKLGKD